MAFNSEFEQDVKVILYEMAEQGELGVDCKCLCDCNCECSCECSECEGRIIVKSDF